MPARRSATARPDAQIRRWIARELAAADLAGAVADHYRLGRCDRSARRGGDAAGTLPAARAVGPERAARAHRRVPPCARGLARKHGRRTPQPLPAHRRRRPSLRTGVPPDLRAARGAMGRQLGARRRPGLTATQRRAVREELGWEGFGTLGTGRARAARRHPLDGVTDRRGVGVASRIITVRARDDPALGGRSLAQAVPQAWNLAHVSADYRRFLRRFGAVIDRFRARRRRRARSGTMFHRAHVVDSRLPARSPSRSATARGAVAARLARRGRVCALPRLLSAQRTAPPSGILMAVLAADGDALPPADGSRASRADARDSRLAASALA